MSLKLLTVIIRQGDISKVTVTEQLDSIVEIESVWCCIIFAFRFGIHFAKCLQTMLEARFPERGMTRLERRVANLLDLRFKGCHLGLWNWLGRTKEEMEQKYMTQPDLEDVEVDLPNPALSPTSKLIHNNQRNEIGTLSELQQELKRYEACTNPGRDADVLSFWRLYQADLPNLARIAKIVLAIPASSSKSERVFSTGGLVVSSKRFNLFH